MKRWIAIISCLLCLACALALCSCSCGRDDGNKRPTGTNAELDELHNNLSNAGASRATAKVFYTLSGEDAEDDDSELKTTIVVNDESLEGEDSLQLPYFVPATSAGGKVTLSPSKTQSVVAAGEAGSKLKAVDFAKFSFDMGNFKNGEYSYANYVFKATVTDADAFFGVALELPPTEVEVTITLCPNGQPKDMKVAYTTESGNAVSIQVSYGYN